MPGVGQGPGEGGLIQGHDGECQVIGVAGPGPGTSKARIAELALPATILRPVFLMENFSTFLASHSRPPAASPALADR